MVKLRGVNVYPTSIGAHLLEHPAALGEYICRVVRQNHRDEMTVIVEAQAETIGNPEVRQDLATFLRRKLGVEVGIEMVGLGETADLTKIDSRQKPIRLLS